MPTRLDIDGQSRGVRRRSAGAGASRQTQRSDHRDDCRRRQRTAAAHVTRRLSPPATASVHSPAIDPRQALLSFEIRGEAERVGSEPSPGLNRSHARRTAHSRVCRQDSRRSGVHRTIGRCARSAHLAAALIRASRARRRPRAADAARATPYGSVATSGGRRERQGGAADARAVRPRPAVADRLDQPAGKAVVPPVPRGSVLPLVSGLDHR